MAFGLEVRDASNNIAMTLTDRLARMHGMGSVSLAAGAAASITVTGMTTDGTWTVYLYDSTGTSGVNADTSISANNLYIVSTETAATGTKTFQFVILRF
jgi:hypothetical protein